MRFTLQLPEGILLVPNHQINLIKARFELRSLTLLNVSAHLASQLMAASFSSGFNVFKINFPRLQKFRGLIGACQRPTRARQTSDTFPDVKSRKPEMSKNKMKLEVVTRAPPSSVPFLACAIFVQLNALNLRAI